MKHLLANCENRLKSRNSNQTLAYFFKTYSVKFQLNYGWFSALDELLIYSSGWVYLDENVSKELAINIKVNEIRFHVFQATFFPERTHYMVIEGSDETVILPVICGQMDEYIQDRYVYLK